MTKRDWFEVGVRLIGVWEIVTGLDELVTYANVAAKLYLPSLTSSNGFLTHATAHLLIGSILFLRATNVVNAVYKTTSVTEPNVD